MRCSSGSRRHVFLPDRARSGPWSPDALHGGPVAALLAGTEPRSEVSRRTDWHPARLTLELVRPVPVAPLTVAARLQRPGARCGSSASRSRRGRHRRSGRQPARDPSGRRARPRAGRATTRRRAGHGRRPILLGSTSDSLRPTRPSTTVGVEHRFVRGGFDQPGPATDWIRLAVPVVAGEPVEPAATGGGRGRLRQWGRPSGEFDELHVHQPRPDRRAPPAARGGVGRASTPSYLQPTASAWPRARCGMRPGGWAAPCRPCSSSTLT